MDFELEHRLPCHGSRRELLHRLYTDPELNGMLAQMRHLKRREVVRLDVDEEVGRAERTVRIEPDMPLPARLRRLIAGGGDSARGLGWEEHSSCDLLAGTIDFGIHLPQLGSRMHADGRYRLLEPEGGLVCRRIHGRVRVAAPMIGAFAERVIVARLEDNMNEEARLTAAFLERRAA